MRSEMFKYYEDEIYRGLRLFGWANGNVLMLKQANKEGLISDEELDELVAIHKKVSKEEIYQF